MSVPDTDEIATITVTTEEEDCSMSREINIRVVGTATDVKEVNSSSKTPATAQTGYNIAGQRVNVQQAGQVVIKKKKKILR